MSQCKFLLKHLLHFFLSLDKKLHLYSLLFLVLTFAIVGIRLSIPFFFKNIVSSLSNLPFSEWAILSFIFGYGIFWMLDQLVMQIRTIITLKVAEGVSRKMSLILLNSLLYCSLNFHVAKKTGALTNQIFLAQSGLQQIFWSGCSFFLPTTIEIVVIASLFFHLYGITYISILLIMILNAITIGILTVKMSIKAQEGHNEKSRHVNAKLVDTLLNFETVKHFGNEEYEKKEMEQALLEQEKWGVKRAFVDHLIQLCQLISIATGFILITFLSGKAVYSGQMQIGDFVLINGYMLQFISPLGYLNFILQQLKKGIYDIYALYKILLKELQQEKSPLFSIAIHRPISITFQHVSFAYSQDRPILQDLSFDILPQQVTAIVGETGSGKSTIARLLFRFYDVTKGHILINDNPISSFCLDTLRKEIGIVSQDIAIFNGSIYSNILYGNPKASKQEVERAIQIAKLDHFIESLPEGYETLVGERGLKLSGGEKQKISIARVILKKPSLFIFDEATSSLDRLTEREIQKNLEIITARATVIIIAHRLSTIVNADQILVLQEGRLIEKGTHQQLMSQDSLYKELWCAQHHFEPILV